MQLDIEQILFRLDARARNIKMGAVSAGHTEDETRALCRDAIAVVQRALLPAQRGEGDDVERVARVIYEDRNKSLANCWSWDDSGQHDPAAAREGEVG